MSFRKHLKTKQLKRTALVLALGMGITGLAFAQSTTGSIFGQAPVASGETVTVSGSTGVTREVSVDNAGRYRVTNLPLGTYTVSLKKMASSSSRVTTSASSWALARRCPSEARRMLRTWRR